MTLNPAVVKQLAALSNLGWNKIKHFYYITKLGSFTNAAKFIDSTQPALSRQIAVLEAELDCKLFTRSSRGVELTRKGKELLAFVEAHYLNLKGFVFNHRAMINNGTQRRISVCATHAVAAYIIGKHLISYSQKNPEITFDIVAEDTMFDLTFHDIDLAIRPYDPQAANVEQEFFFSFEKKLFASQAYIDLHGNPQTPEEFLQHNIIAYSHPEKNPHADLHWIINIGMPMGKFREPILKTTSFENAIAAAVSGIGIVASYEEMDNIKKSGLVRVGQEFKGPKINQYLVYPQHLVDDNDILALKNYLLSKI